MRQNSNDTQNFVNYPLPTVDCPATLVGIAIGATRSRPFVGVPLGIFVGGVVGALAGAVLAEPRNLPVALIGSALLVLLGVAVRVLSSRPHGT